MAFHYGPYLPPAGAIVARIPAGIASKKELLNALATGLGLPAHFGRNWDALEESLREFSWAPGARVIAIVHDALPRLPEDELRTYLEVLSYSAAALRTAKDRVPSLRFVFPADARVEVERLVSSQP